MTTVEGIMSLIVLILAYLGLKNVFGPKRDYTFDPRLEELKAIREATKEIKQKQITALEEYRAKKEEYDKLRNEPTDSN